MIKVKIFPVASPNTQTSNEHYSIQERLCTLHSQQVKKAVFGNAPAVSIPGPYIRHILTVQHSQNTPVHFIPITVPPDSNMFSFTVWSLNIQPQF